MTKEFTFTADNRQEVTDALREIMLTPLGEDYKRTYYTRETGEDDLEKVLTAAQVLAGGPNITVNLMAQALELLIDSGGIQPRDFAPATLIAEPEEDVRPRDKNDKVLNESQLRYREYREFSETASTADVNRRKQTDSGYASYVRKQLAAEMNQPIDGAVVPVGDQGTRVEPNAELARFARAYLAEPTVNLRPRGGYVLLGGELIPYATFIEKVNKCAAIKLL